MLAKCTLTSGSSCLTSTSSGASSEQGTTAALAVLAARLVCPLAARLPPAAAARFLAGTFGVWSGVSGSLPSAPSVAVAASAAEVREAGTFLGLPRCRFFGGRAAGMAGIPNV